MIHKVGDYVRIKDREHPHYGSLGTVETEATGGPYSLGLDWLINLEGGSLTGACYVDDDEIEVWPNAAQ